MTLHATCDRCGKPGREAARHSGDGHGYEFDGPDCVVNVRLVRLHSAPPFPYEDLCLPCVQALVQETMAGTKKNGPRF